MTGPGTNNEQGTFRGAQQGNGVRQRVGWRSDSSASSSPGWRAGAGLRRLLLHVIGQHEVADIAFYQSCFAGQGHQFGWVGRTVHALAEPGDVGESGFEVKILESASALVFRRYLAAQRQHRRPIDLGIVETGEQIR